MRLGIRQLGVHVATLLLLAVCAGSLAAAVTALPLVVTRVADERFAATFDADAAVPPTLNVSGPAGDGADPETILDTIARTLDTYPDRLDEPLRSALADAQWELRLDPIDAEVPGAPRDTVRLTITVSPAAADRIVDGVAPVAWGGDGPLEIGVSQPVADRLGLRLGDTVTTALAPLRVAAITAPGDVPSAAAGRFHAPVEEPLAAGGSVVTAAVTAHPGSLPGLVSLLPLAGLDAFYPVSGAGLAAADGPTLSAALRSATSRGLDLPSGVPLNVTTRLPPALEELDGDAEQFAAASVLITSAPLGALATTTFLAMQAYAARRRRARVLLAARGAGAWRLGRDGALETALVAVPAVAVGMAAGTVVVARTFDPGSLTIPASVAVAIVAIGGALAPASAATRGPHPAIRPIIELLVVGVGVLSAVLLRQRGLVTTAHGVDPLLAVTPLLCALEVSVILIRVLPVGFGLLSRVLHSRPDAASLVGVARLARGSGLGFAALLCIVVAVAAASLSVVLDDALSVGATDTARTAVGADVRIDGPGSSSTGIAEVAGVRAVVRVDRIGGIAMAEGGRLRGADVFVADAAQLRAVRPDLDILHDADTVVALTSDAVTGTPDDDLTVGGIPIDRASERPAAALPDGGAPWVLLDAATAAKAIGEERVTPVWALVTVDPGASPAAVAALLRARFGDTVIDVDAVRAEIAGRPAYVALRGILALSAWVSAVLAAAAVVLSVLGRAAERARTLGALRMLGMPPRRRLVIVVWEVLPTTLAGALAGVLLGAALASLIAETAGIGAVVSTGALVLNPPVLAIAAAAAVFAVGISAVGALAAVGSRRVRGASGVRMGAS